MQDKNLKQSVIKGFLWKAVENGGDQLITFVISIVLACIASWALIRTGMKAKGLFAALFTVPMLIPSYSHASGLILVFGQSGILTKALGLDTLFGSSSYIYGFWGVVLGSVMFSLPIAFIMISDIMKYEDSTPYEVAEVMGLSFKHRFAAITYPYYRKPMISVIFVVFSSIITDYGVPHIIGGQYNTLASLMYNNTVKLLDYERGGIYGDDARGALADGIIVRQLGVGGSEFHGELAHGSSSPFADTALQFILRHYTMSRRGKKGEIRTITI